MLARCIEARRPGRSRRPVFISSAKHRCHARRHVLTITSLGNTTTINDEIGMLDQRGALMLLDYITASFRAAMGDTAGFYARLSFRLTRRATTDSATVAGRPSCRQAPLRFARCRRRAVSLRPGAQVAHEETSLKAPRAQQRYAEGRAIPRRHIAAAGTGATKRGRHARPACRKCRRRAVIISKVEAIFTPKENSS